MKKCKLCREVIDQKATVCPYCGSAQNWICRIIKVTGLINIAAVAAIVLAFVQVENAKEEKILAVKANASAEAALARIDSISMRISQLAKLYSEVAYIESNDYTINASGAIVYPEMYHHKLDSLMQFVEPDSTKRNLWLKSLRK